MAYAATTRVTHRENIRTGKNLEVDGTASVAILKVGGTEQIQNVGRVFRGSAAAASVATAGAGTYTAANILTGTILRDCTGSSRTDTLDTAANIVAALTTAFGVAPAVGDCIDVLVSNASDPVTEIITIAAGSGGAFAAAQTDVSKTILGTDSRLLRIRIASVTSSAESYVLYM